MSVKKYLKTWLYFNRSDRIGGTVLLVLITVSLVLPAFWTNQPQPLPFSVSARLDLVVDSFVKIRRSYERLPAHPFERRFNDSAPPRQLLNINTADSAQLEALPFIGEKLAARIVHFREAVGGFHTLEQLHDIYGLRDSAYQIIAPRLSCDGRVRKLDLNTASQEDLQHHPYLRYKMAKLIVNYRAAHGSIKPEELLRLPGMDTVMPKLKPYLME